MDLSKLEKTTLASEQTHEIVNKGISQTFDYGIGMTVLVLFLLVSLAFNVWLLRCFLKFIKDMNKLAADMFALCGTMKTHLDNIYAQYNEILVFLNKKKG